MKLARKGLKSEASLSGNDFQIAPTTRTVQRGNTTYEMDTANIGHAANAQSRPSLVDAVEPAAGGAGMEAVVTKGLDRLKNAWRAASPPARRSFREWVVTQPLEDLAVGVSSEKTKGYSAVIARSCLPAALAEAPPPEGFVYFPDLLSSAEQDALLHDVQALTYDHGEFRGKKMKRLWAQFGYTYDAVSRKLEAAPPIPQFLQAVIDKASPYYPAGIEFAQCIVTRYPVDAGIGWHADAKPFGDCILGVSLASEARLQFRPKGETQASFEVTASPGSLYVIQGVARWDYEHRLVPVKAERYSLTFRSIA